jgi:hypothetical protein
MINYIIIASKKQKIYSILLILITLPILIQRWNLRGGVLSKTGIPIAKGKVYTNVLN